MIRVPPVSGIVNDSNDCDHEAGDSRYISDLVERVVTVSVETMRITSTHYQPWVLSTVTQ